MSRSAVSPTYHMILFYSYRERGAAALPGGAAAFCAAHRALCAGLGLTGRVLVAEEGLNGTLASADRAALDAYTDALKRSPLFALSERDFKRSTADREPFPDLFVKVVPEIINTGGVISVPEAGQGGVHLSPEEFHAKLQHVASGGGSSSSGSGLGSSSGSGSGSGTTTNSNPDAATRKETVLIDVRTHKEYMVGRFKGAVDPQLRTFAEFPAYLEGQADQLKGKTVLMYCTGGIRCEKASFHLKNLGVEDVYQLRGGIHKYLEKYPDGGNWEGKNFVFDKRVFQPAPNINPAQAVVGACYECDAAFDQLDGDAGCTVCRDMVLVCHACRPRLGFQYHCVHHRDLKRCYFTDLSSFSRADLKAQRAGLEAVLQKLGEGGQGKGGALKKTKNRRRTVIRTRLAGRTSNRRSAHHNARSPAVVTHGHVLPIGQQGVIWIPEHLPDVAGVVFTGIKIGVIAHLNRQVHGRVGLGHQHTRGVIR